MDINYSSEHLRERIRERREKQKKQLLIILAVVIFAAAGWIWHSLYGNSPERAMEQLQSSVSRHDTKLFHQHLQTEAVLTALCSDLTTSLIDDDIALKESRRQHFIDFYRLIRPELVQGFAKAIDGYIATGQWPELKCNDLLKGRALAVDFERLLERSKLRTTEIVSVGKAKTDNNTAQITVRVREKQTGIEQDLQLILTKGEDGSWQVTAVNKYRDYLDAVLAKQNLEIANYVAATVDTVSRSNGRLSVLESRFYFLTRRAAGHYGPKSIAALDELINGEIIPCLKARQASLDAVPTPPGAEYLAELRHKSTELDIAAWQHFLKGLTEKSRTELDKAETLKKQTLEIELRIEDIIKRRTVSPALPQLN